MSGNSNAGLRCLSAAVAGLMLLAGCTRGEIEYSETALDESVEFQASFEDVDPESRTFLDESMRLCWNADDRLSLFVGNTVNQQFSFQGKDGDRSGSFLKIQDGSFISGNGISNNVAVYPYSTDTRMEDDGTLKITIPDTQEYSENSFGRGANMMVAVTQNTSDNFLAFKNLGGYLRFRLFGDAKISSAVLKGNCEEVLAGQASVTAAYGQDPVLKMENSSSRSITLNLGDGLQLPADEDDAVELWFALRPVTFVSGFTLTLFTSDGREMSLYTTGRVTVERNKVSSMSARRVECVALPVYHTVTNHHVDFCGNCVATFDSPRHKDPHFDGDALIITWEEFNRKVLNDVDLSYEQFMNMYDVSNLYVLDIDNSTGKADSSFVDARSYTYPDGVSVFTSLGIDEYITATDILALYVDSEVAAPSSAEIEFVLKPKDSASLPILGFRFSYTVSERSRPITSIALIPEDTYNGKGVYDFTTFYSPLDGFYSDSFIGSDKVKMTYQIRPSDADISKYGFIFRNFIPNSNALSGNDLLRICDFVDNHNGTVTITVDLVDVEKNLYYDDPTNLVALCAFDEDRHEVFSDQTYIRSTKSFNEYKLIHKDFTSSETSCMTTVRPYRTSPIPIEDPSDCDLYPELPTPVMIYDGSVDLSEYVTLCAFNSYTSECIEADFLYTLQFNLAGLDGSSGGYYLGIDGRTDQNRFVVALDDGVFEVDKDFLRNPRPAIGRTPQIKVTAKSPRRSWGDVEIAESFIKLNITE